MLTDWTHHPITKAMLKVIEELVQNNKEDILGRVIEGVSLGVQDIHELSQLRGQVLAREQILSIKEFLSEIVEEETKSEI